MGNGGRNAIEHRICMNFTIYSAKTWTRLKEYGFQLIIEHHNDITRRSKANDPMDGCWEKKNAFACRIEGNGWIEDETRKQPQPTRRMREEITTTTTISIATDRSKTMMRQNTERQIGAHTHTQTLSHMGLASAWRFSNIRNGKKLNKMSRDRLVFSQFEIFRHCDHNCQLDSSSQMFALLLRGGFFVLAFADEIFGVLN